MGLPTATPVIRAKFPGCRRLRRNLNRARARNPEFRPNPKMPRMKKTIKSHASRRSARRPRPRSESKSGPSPARPNALPRAVAVLGMHRSGTSALTRVISLLGADLPKNLMHPSPENEAGYWESGDLVVIHDEILASGGSYWHDWRAFNPDWYASPAAPIFRQRVLNVLRNDYANAQLFVIKDPRICRFWPFYREVLDEFGAKPGVVIPIRNPLEVMASLRRRDGFLSAKSGLLWLRHVLDAEKATRDLPRAVVTYDALLSNWQGVVAALAAGLQLRWPRRAALADLQIERFLTTQFRHHAIAPEQLAARAEVVDWVKGAYAALVQLSVTPEHKASIVRLERIRAEFEKASSAFGVALLEGESELARREAENAHFHAENADLQQRVTVLSDEQQRLSAEQDTVTVRLTEDLQSTHAALSEERQKAAEQVDQLTAFEADRAAAVQDAQQLTAARDALKEKLEHAHTTLSAERQKAAEQADQLVFLETARRTAEETQAATAADASRHWAELNGLKKKLEDAHTVLSAERHKVATQSDQLADLERERSRAETSLTAAAAEAQQLRDELAVQAQIVAEQSAMIGHLQDAQARTEKDRDFLGRCVEKLESAVTRLEVDLSGSRSRAVQLDSALEAAQRCVEYSAKVATATSTTAARLETELSTAGARAARSEASLARATRELSEIKRPAGWRLLTPIRRIANRVEIRANLRLIESSSLFDRAWYLENCPEVAELDPILHYLQIGALKGRNPSPLFDNDWYLDQYPDVRAMGINPLVHYLRYGTREGREPSALFDGNWYLAKYLDVRASGANPLVHYVRHGAAEGRDPSPDFDSTWYLRENPDVRSANFNPLVHYVTKGIAEGRRPNASFENLNTHADAPTPMSDVADLRSADRNESGS
jgi:hypothetical protein